MLRRRAARTPGGADRRAARAAVPPLPRCRSARARRSRIAAASYLRSSVWRPVPEPLPYSRSAPASAPPSPAFPVPGRRAGGSLRRSAPGRCSFRHCAKGKAAPRRAPGWTDSRAIEALRPPPGFRSSGSAFPPGGSRSWAERADWPDRPTGSDFATAASSPCRRSAPRRLHGISAAGGCC
ncbi:hypothetical protein SDC9_173837 [bioreactor metagenome]|uniref:Uncharacterized protein n=1 Tax=bioreactor metagenome TaxID=1076179 RepID=A0A645GS08_9ZZZZ